MGRLAIAQMTSTNNPAKNYEQVVNLIKAAKAQHADILCLPESFAFISTHRPSTLANAQPLTGPLLAQYLSLAKTHNIWLSLGGFHEKHPTLSSKIFNTHVLVDNYGCIVGKYRKAHLFDAKVVKEDVRESKSTERGDGMCCVKDTPVGGIGLSICYDLRFPSLYNVMRVCGADVLLVPSAFFVATGKAHWELLLRARAVENQCYVVGAAQVGVHGDGRVSWGHALVVDPWGKVLVDMGVECGVRTVEIEKGVLESVRAKMDVVEQRRGDLYGELRLP